MNHRMQSAVIAFFALAIQHAAARSKPMMATNTSSSLITADAGFHLQQRQVLDPTKGSRVHFSWGRKEQDPSTMYFQVEAQTEGWVGIGFNDREGMSGADMVLGWVDDAGNATFKDLHGTSDSDAPVQDLESNVCLLGAHQNGTHTIFRWSRLVDTKDPNKQDFTLTESPVEILWAYTEKDPLDGKPGYHDRRGHMKLTLLN